MNIKKYRKKPVVIEAMHFDGHKEAADNAIKWIGDKCLGVRMSYGYIKDNLEPVVEYPVTLTIETLEGNHHCSPGDYIIKGIKGEFYPCKPDIFKATYSEVKDERQK